MVLARPSLPEATAMGRPSVCLSTGFLQGLILLAACGFSPNQQVYSVALTIFLCVPILPSKRKFRINGLGHLQL